MSMMAWVVKDRVGTALTGAFFVVFACMCAASLWRRFARWRQQHHTECDHNHHKCRYCGKQFASEDQ
jgi:uncharacterized paraquat-inducible protein A